MGTAPHGNPAVELAALMFPVLGYSAGLQLAAVLDIEPLNGRPGEGKGTLGPVPLTQPIVSRCNGFYFSSHI